MLRAIFAQRLSLCLLLGQLLGSANAVAGDWPQILGPQRNGFALDETLMSTWPEAGPAVAWEHPCGAGVAGVAVAQGQVLLFHRQGAHNVLESLDLATGKPMWSQKFRTTFQAGILNDDGPRCVPTVDGNDVIVLGPQGDLHCVERTTGTTRWSVDTHKTYRAAEGYFGVGHTPLVLGPHIIANVGGKSGAGVVAFLRTTGAEVWKTSSEEASYSATISAPWANQSEVLCLTRLKLLCLDPASGTERWSIPFGQRGPTVNGAAPVVAGEHVFLTASYGIGATLLQRGAGVPKVEYQGDELLSAQYATPLWRDGQMLAIEGRQDGGSVQLVSLNPLTRKVLWKTRLPDYGTLIGTPEHALVVLANGEAALIRWASPAAPSLKFSKLHTGTTRALPALANGRLLLKNERLLRCLVVGTANQP